MNTFYDSITLWFHTYDRDDISPSITAMYIADLFIERINKFGFELAIEHKKFRNMLCEFFCTHYHVVKINQLIVGPKYLPKIPSDWTNEIFERWLDYLDHYYLTEEFWESYWGVIPKSALLEVIKGWIPTLQALLPYYIKCNTEVLIEQEIIVMKEGIIHVKEEVNTYEEDDYTRKDQWDY